MSVELYYPERALALFVIVALVFFIVRSHRMRKVFGAILRTNKSLDRSQSFNAPRNRFIKEFLFVTALVLVAIALMRPRWGEKERRRKVQSVDLCIGLDLSQSMLAEDMAPNRLRFAKREITLLLEKIGDYRASLIGFAGGAFVAAPLTSDLEAVADLMSPMDTTFVSMPSTYLEGALITCAESLGYPDISQKQEGEDDKSSAGVILLVTDGDDKLDLDSAVIDGLKRKKIVVNSFLVGKEQPAQMPFRDEMGNLTGFVKDPITNAVATTQLEFKKVKELSEETGGKLYVANQIADFGDLFRSDLKKFETRAREEGVEIEKEEQFQIPLLFALLFLFIELLLTETGGLWPVLKKKYLNFIWLLFFFSSSAHAVGLVESLRNNFGVFLFERGKFQQAHNWFQDNIESSPENSQFLFNWASAKLNKIEEGLEQLAKEGKLDPKQMAQTPDAQEAGELAKLIDSLAKKESDPAWKKKWYFQLGNAYEMSGQGGLAIDAYYEALQDPPWADLDLQARHNLARLLKMSKSGGGGGDGQGGGEGGGGGQSGGGSQDQQGQDQGQQKQPQDYKGKNFTQDQVKQILQNVGSEERNVMKKKSREEAKKRANEWSEGNNGRPW